MGILPSLLRLPCLTSPGSTHSAYHSNTVYPGNGKHKRHRQTATASPTKADISHPYPLAPRSASRASKTSRQSAPQTQTVGHRSRPGHGQEHGHAPTLVALRDRDRRGSYETSRTSRETQEPVTPISGRFDPRSRSQSHTNRNTGTTATSQKAKTEGGQGDVPGPRRAATLPDDVGSSAFAGIHGPPLGRATTDRDSARSPISSPGVTLSAEGADPTDSIDSVDAAPPPSPLSRSLNSSPAPYSPPTSFHSLVPHRSATRPHAADGEPGRYIVETKGEEDDARRRKLRKILRVEGDWEVLREGDCTGWAANGRVGGVAEADV